MRPFRQPGTAEFKPGSAGSEERRNKMQSPIFEKGLKFVFEDLNCMV
jgi:hypothetical protein